MVNQMYENSGCCYKLWLTNLSDWLHLTAFCQRLNKKWGYSVFLKSQVLGLKMHANFIVEAKDNLKIVILSVRTEISESSVRMWEKEGIKTGYCLNLNDFD